MSETISYLYEFLLSMDIEEYKTEFKKFLLKFLSFHQDFESFYAEASKNNRIRFHILDFPIEAYGQAFLAPTAQRPLPRKSKPDLFILIDEVPVMPVELEVVLHSLDQLEQLWRYFKATTEILLERSANDNTRMTLAYLQYFRTVCIAFDISERVKTEFPFNSGEKCPLILFPIVKKWMELPQESLTYLSFKFIHDHPSSESEQRLKADYEEIFSRLENIPKRFYFSNLIKMFGDERMSALVNQKIANKELVSEENLEESKDPVWDRFIKARLKNLKPEDLKALEPEQLKALEPEQLKALEPEQLKALEPEQLVKAFELMDENAKKKIIDAIRKMNKS